MIELLATLMIQMMFGVQAAMIVGGICASVIILHTMAHNDEK